MIEVDLSLGPEMLQAGFFLLSHLSSGVTEPWLHQSGDVPPHSEGFLHSAISLFLLFTFQKIINYLLIFLSILLAPNLRAPRQIKTGQPEDWPVVLRVPSGLNNLVRLEQLPPVTWPCHCLGPRQAVIAQFPPRDWCEHNPAARLGWPLVLYSILASWSFTAELMGISEAFSSHYSGWPSIGIPYLPYLFYFMRERLKEGWYITDCHPSLEVLKQQVTLIYTCLGWWACPRK